MRKVLVTGATGNIGREVIHFLNALAATCTPVAGVRDVDRARSTFKHLPGLEFVHFDFEDEQTFAQSLLGIDTVFLLRPPNLADVDRFFAPFISAMKAASVEQILFLSVQGAEKSSVIPHNKIERCIQGEGLSYIFLRPSYFMQNLTTTLIDDIQKRREIVLPAGKAKFNWIDIQNIGEVAALLLDHFETYKNQAIELTGEANLNFEQVVREINAVAHSNIQYRRVGPIRFYFIKRARGMARGMVFVMLLLHFLPRFQSEPQISGFYETLTGKKPTALKDFILREQKRFANS